MYTNDDLNLCDLCFASLPRDAKCCPHCDGTRNIQKYPTAIPDGTILSGRYSVGKVLGKGGFGITYLCYDLKERKKVAIKEYFPDTLAHRNTGETTVSTYGSDRTELFLDGSRKFFEEARLVSRFNGNPNVISVYEFFNSNNTTYFVMEYLSGTDMKGYIKKYKRLPEGEVLYIADRMTEALAVVHSMNTFHRDIAPDNIFLTDTGDIKLIDFGAARSVVANESKSLSVILKHGFAPMEQYQRKGKQGPWTDIYALGATLYLALMGKMPDDAMTRFEDPALDLEGVSPELARIIEKMMAVRIEERYSDILSLRKDLAALSIPITPIVIEKREDPKAFCAKCSKEIPVGQALCTECRGEAAAAVSASAEDRSGGTADSGNKKRKKILLPIIVAFGVVLLLGVIAMISVVIMIVQLNSGGHGSGGAAFFLGMNGGAESTGPEYDDTYESRYDDPEDSTDAADTTDNTEPEDSKVDIGDIVPSMPDGNDGDTGLGDKDGESGKDDDKISNTVSWMNNVMIETYNDASVSTVFGNQKYVKSQIDSIIIENSLEGASDKAWDISQKGNGSVMVWVEKNGQECILHIGGNGGINAGKICRELFAGFSNLTSISFNGDFHTEYTIDMRGMFKGCKSLKSIDVSSLCTRNVTTMLGMFEECTNLESVNVSTFETVNVVDFSRMFSKCSSLEAIDLNSFNTAKADNMRNMFYGCKALKELDIRGFWVPGATVVMGMFDGCDKLKSINTENKVICDEFDKTKS